LGKEKKELEGKGVLFKKKKGNPAVNVPGQSAKEKLWYRTGRKKQCSKGEDGNVVDKKNT